MPLWQHSEWATRVIAPRWVDVDTLGSQAIELVVPSFGDSVKAVLIVLTLSDGPGQQFMQLADRIEGTNYNEFLSYRLQLGIRGAPYATDNPHLVAGSPTLARSTPRSRPMAAGWRTPRRQRRASRRST